MAKTAQTAQDAPQAPAEPEGQDATQAAVDAAVWAATHDAEGNPLPIVPDANPIA